jgi:very-short-patch-repair endonuclease
MNEVDRGVAALARRQFGVFSRAQALGCGATPNMIQSRLNAGRWQRILHGVYVVAGAPSSWRRSLIAACLAAGDGAAASHRSAAALWQLRGFEPGVVEITVNRARRLRRPGIVEHAALMLPTIDVARVDAIPVTTPTRTILDLAAIAPRDAVEEALDDALRRKLTTPRRLTSRIGELGRRPGAALARDLVRARSSTTEVPQSVFETRLLRALRAAGLPTPTPQHEIRRSGRLIAVVDFAWPSMKLAVEADGYAWHSGRITWEKDSARRNAVTCAGWRVVHVTWNDLHHHETATLARIRDALAPVE